MPIPFNMQYKQSITLFKTDRSYFITWPHNKENLDQTVLNNTLSKGFIAVYIIFGSIIATNTCFCNHGHRISPVMDTCTLP